MPVEMTPKLALGLVSLFHTDLGPLCVSLLCQGKLMHDSNCCWLEQPPAFRAATITLLLSPGKSSLSPSSSPQGFLSLLLGWLGCSELHLPENAALVPQTLVPQIRLRFSISERSFGIKHK